MWTLCSNVYIYLYVYIRVKKRDNNRDRMGSTHSAWDPAPGSNVVAPRDFKRIFSDFKPQFAGWKQQDPIKWVMSGEFTQCTMQCGAPQL